MTDKKEDKKEEKEEKHEEKKEHKTVHHKTASKGIKKVTLWQTISVALLVLLVISVLMQVFGSNGSVAGAELSSDEAAATAIGYINTNLLLPGTEAELLSVEQEGTLYHMKIKIDEQEFDSYISTDGKTLYPSSIDLSELESGNETEAEPTETGNETETTPVEKPVTTPTAKKGTFTVTGDELCEEGGKPLIMLFSTTWCPHCTWIIETYDSTVKSYGDDIAAYHWELDTGDNTLTEEVETEVPADLKAYYSKYNPKGSIPTFVFGCQYSRTGNGYESANDLDAEEAEFKKIIDELIGAEPIVEEPVAEETNETSA